MNVDDFIRRKLVVRGNIAKIGTELAAVTDRNFDMPLRRERNDSKVFENEA